MIGTPLDNIQSFWRRHRTLIAINVLFLAGGLLAAEIFLRSRGFDPYFRFLPGWPVPPGPSVAAYVEADPTFGWVSSRESKEINSQGFRDVKDYGSLEPGSSNTRLMVLGDSFMWGAGVLRRESIPGLLDIDLGEHVDVYNLSTPGWGIDQMYLAYEHFAPMLDPQIVLLAFIDNDISRVLEAHRPWENLDKPVLEAQGGKLRQRTHSSPVEIWLNKIAAKSVLFSQALRQLYLAREARPLVRQIFKDLLTDAKIQNRRLIVLRLPTAELDLSTSNRELCSNDFGSTFSGTDGTYFDVLNELRAEPSWRQLYYLDNGHFSRAGNRKVADFLLREAFSEITPQR